MASILRQAHVRHTFGGEDTSGWIPPHAPMPPRTPQRTVDLLVQIQHADDGFILQWSGPELADCGSHWYAELAYAEHAAEELFGITSNHWEAERSGT